MTENTNEMTMEQACTAAIALAGGGSALAQKLTDLAGQKKISRSAISQWKIVPRDRVIGVEKVLGKRMTRYELRPDAYPKDDD